MRVRKAEAAFATLLVLTAASYAGWREDASAGDVQRLEQLSEAKAKGMMEAQSAPPSDLAAIRSILTAGAVSSGKATGTWKCRTMKLGGLTPTIVYGWFSCRISDRGGRLFFEKLGGSQRTSGYLYPDGGGYVYLGAASVHYNGANEAPHAYSGTGASVGAAQTPDDQIGLLTLTYDGRARLELPYPVQESTFDVIELKR